MNELVVSMLNVLFLNCKYSQQVKDQLDRMTTYEYSFDTYENFKNNSVIVTANKLINNKANKLPITITFDLGNDKYIKKIEINEA